MTTPRGSSPDFSDVKSGSAPDFSDVKSGSASEAMSRADATARPATQEKVHTVVKGDTLSKIAKAHYGDANQWRKIYEANKERIKNPDLIQPGWVLTIPDSET